MPAIDRVASKRLKRNHRLRVVDAGDDLHLVGDEMADIVRIVEVELRENVVIAGRGIDFGSDFGIGEGGRDLVCLAEPAFDLHKKCLHFLFFFPCRCATSGLPFLLRFRAYSCRRPLAFASA